MDHFLPSHPLFAGTVPGFFWHEFRRFSRNWRRLARDAHQFGTGVSIRDLTERIMGHDCEIAIIGAGPYGLSLAAHLRARGIDHRIFGKPLDTWTSHMPKNMTLKSEGFASNLSAPAADSTIRAWSNQKSMAYADQGRPIPLDDFLTYADTFRNRFVPDVEDT